MRFFIETYGCQMNVAESNSIESGLIARGHEVAKGPEDADVAIINTCSVRKSAENRIWGRLGLYSYLKTKRKMLLILTGCMAQRLGEEARKLAPQIDHVVGVNDKLSIPELVDKGSMLCHDSYPFTTSYHHEGDFSAYVPIMNGCNNFCTYCIVPYVRGREASRNPDEVLDEVSRLDSLGVREITLLGQNVNSYDYDGMRFPELLRKVCERSSSIRWVRFESPHPKDFSDELIEVIATEDRVAKHLHVPMQSGSTPVLHRMNRRYSREQYLSLIDRIRKRVPGITFAVDVMVGFPGETEDDFQQTLSAMREVGYIEAYMYYWNAREGTKAVEMPDQIPEEARQERLSRLIDFQLAECASIKKGRANGTQTVLVTGVSRDNSSQMLGRNEHNEMVVFDTDTPLAPGDLVEVEFLGLNGNTYTGRLQRKIW